jgi:type II secretory pathway pseudopilin PulG
MPEMENKRNKRQKGAILITLIVAIVVIALSGSAMLYFSTTSTYGELFTNRQERAYYVGESGINYALQRYLADETLFSPASPAVKTLSNGDQFSVSSEEVSKGSPAEAWLVIKSTGVVGTGWLTTRQLVTKEMKKALATPPGFPPIITDNTGVPLGFDANSNDQLDTTWIVTPGTITDIVDTGPSGEPALQFKGVYGSIDINPTELDLYSAWENNGYLSSYFTQVKIKIVSEGNKGLHYLIGLTFRKVDNNNFYGVSFYRSSGLNPPGGLPYWCTPVFTNIIGTKEGASLNDGQVYAVLWKSINGVKTVLAYALMKSAVYGVVTDGTNTRLADWSTILLRINERFDGIGGRINRIKVYVMGPTASATNWNISSYKQVTWTWPSTTSEFIDNSITSNGFTASRTEIGVHAYYDGNAANDQFFKDFSLAVQGTGGGGSQY